MVSKSHVLTVEILSKTSLALDYDTYHQKKKKISSSSKNSTPHPTLKLQVIPRASVEFFPVEEKKIPFNPFLIADPLFFCALSTIIIIFYFFLFPVLLPSLFWVPLCFPSSAPLNTPALTFSQQPSPVLGSLTFPRLPSPLQREPISP